jgi:hypothetical protein
MSDPREESGDWEVSNVVPIRPQMMFVFAENTPIEDDATAERIQCKRYEEGLCRDCDEPRGQYSPWCRTHFPWTPEEWVERMDRDNP